MRAGRGVAWQGWVGAVAAVIVLALFLRWVLRSDEQILSGAVDDARDALVEGRDEEFLAFFAPDVSYRGSGDFASLRRDLARWRAAGISRVFVASREFEVHGDTADVHLVVAVGPGLLDLGAVTVDLQAAKDEDGDWRVRTFSWSRQ